MSYVGVPQACEAVAIKLGTCAQKLRDHAQAIVRPDLDSESTRRLALEFVMQSQSMLSEIEGMLAQPKPKAARNV